MQVGLFLILALGTLVVGRGQLSNSIPSDGSDLASFVTRPELRPPIYDITIYDPDHLASGYIFVAPYERVSPEIRTKKFYSAQVGPCIYDSKGELIWSGAQLFKNRNAYNFRPTSHAPGSNLAFSWGLVQDNIDHMKGAGVIMNSSYDIISVTPPSHGSAQHDMHEFDILPGEKTALRITTVPLIVDISALQERSKSAWVNNEGFQEYDLQTGQVIFEWWALDHLNLSDSWTGFPTFETVVDRAWDVFHVNSVDKDPSTGNYLVSVRHFDAVFLISGSDGSILWQLGGNKTSFSLTNPFVKGDSSSKFSFLGQHDPRFYKCGSILSSPPDCGDAARAAEKNNSTIISIFDNAAHTSEPNRTSRSLLISLNTSSKKATVLQQHLRPDGGLSFKRGNVQYLPNGNAFIGWSTQGYLSEHVTLSSGKSQCVMEGSFRSPRLGVYRSYKFDSFIGQPKEDIAFKHFVYGPQGAKTDRTKAVHVFYVSWNGATQVHTWIFYRANSIKTRKNTSQRPYKDKFDRIGSSPRSGFETSFTTSGWTDWAWVAAVDKEGNVLGTSSRTKIVMPETWNTNYPVQQEEFSSEYAVQEEELESNQSMISIDKQVFHQAAAEPGLASINYSLRNARYYGFLLSVSCLSFAGIVIMGRHKKRRSIQVS